jgi:hypothetical protein
MVRRPSDADPSAAPDDLAEDEPDLGRQVRNALLAIAAWGAIGFAAALAATLD